MAIGHRDDLKLFAARRQSNEVPQIRQKTQSDDWELAQEILVAKCKSQSASRLKRNAWGTRETRDAGGAAISARILVSLGGRSDYSLRPELRSRCRILAMLSAMR